MKNEKTYGVPVHLQDAHYKSAGKLGHGIGYKYAHDYKNHYVKQQYLPDELEGTVFYEPTDNGYEKKIKEHLDKIKAEGEEAEEPEENKKTEEEKETIENEKSEEGNEAEEGKKAEEEIETAETRKEENYESRQQPRFCCMCGAKLVPGQRFCQCGARILLTAVEVNPDDADEEKKNLFYYLERFISYHL